MRPFSLHFGSDTPSPTMENCYYLAIIYVIIIISLWILYMYYGISRLNGTHLPTLEELDQEDSHPEDEEMLMMMILSS